MNPYIRSGLPQGPRCSGGGAGKRNPVATRHARLPSGAAAVGIPPQPPLLPWRLEGYLRSLRLPCEPEAAAGYAERVASELRGGPGLGGFAAAAVVAAAGALVSAEGAARLAALAGLAAAVGAGLLAGFSLLARRLAAGALESLAAAIRAGLLAPDEYCGGSLWDALEALGGVVEGRVNRGLRGFSGRGGGRG